MRTTLDKGRVCQSASESKAPSPNEGGKANCSIIYLTDRNTQQSSSDLRTYRTSASTFAIVLLPRHRLNSPKSQDLRDILHTTLNVVPFQSSIIPILQLNLPASPLFVFGKAKAGVNSRQQSPHEQSKPTNLTPSQSPSPDIVEMLFSTFRITCRKPRVHPTNINLYMFCVTTRPM